MKGDKNRKNLYDALIKKANGFYYNETIEEYTFDSPEAKKDKILLKKGVIDLCENQNEQLKLDLSGGNENDLSSSKKIKDIESENSQRPTLSKKKITTHYIPPDLNAIKILLEDNDSEIENDYSLLTLKELEDLAKKLIDDLGLKN